MAPPIISNYGFCGLGFALFWLWIMGKVIFTFVNQIITLAAAHMYVIASNASNITL